MSRVALVHGDLTREAADAIVNAANSSLLGGGGVDGAIHRAAGPELLAACRAIPEVSPGIRCPTGEARITPGYRLAARWVIHTVGPVYTGSKQEAEQLAAAHRASLELAVGQGLRHIAFPAISCGAFGYPPEAAAAIATKVVRERAWPLDEIRFVLYSAELYEIWRGAAGAPS